MGQENDWHPSTVTWCRTAAATKPLALGRSATARREVPRNPSSRIGPTHRPSRLPPSDRLGRTKPQSPDPDGRRDHQNGRAQLVECRLKRYTISAAIPASCGRQRPGRPTRPVRLPHSARSGSVAASGSSPAESSVRAAPGIDRRTASWPGTGMGIHLCVAGCAAGRGS
jgi:hypothetical protein